MTISDFIERLSNIMKNKSITQSVSSDAQVKIGKNYDDTEDVFNFFDIIRKSEKEIILKPSNAWERKHGNC